MEIDLNRLDDPEYMMRYVAANEKTNKKSKRQMKKASKRNEYVDEVFKNLANVTNAVSEAVNETVEVNEVKEEVPVQEPDSIEEPVEETVEDTTVENVNDTAEVMSDEKVIDDEDDDLFYLGDYDRLWVSDDIIGDLTFTAKPDQEFINDIDDDHLGELMAITLLNIISKLSPKIVTTAGYLEDKLLGVTKFDVNKFIFVRYYLFNDDDDMVHGFICTDEDRQKWNEIMNVYIAQYNNTEIANILLNITKYLENINFQSLMVGDWADFKEKVSTDEAIDNFFTLMMEDNNTVIDSALYNTSDENASYYNIENQYSCYDLNTFETVIYDMLNIEEEEGTGGANAEQQFRTPTADEGSDDDDSSNGESLRGAGDESVNSETSGESEEEIQEEEKEEESEVDEQGGDIDISDAVSEAFQDVIEETKQELEQDS